MRPWSLLTILNFSERGQSQRYFNVSTPLVNNEEGKNFVLYNLNIAVAFYRMCLF